jgi:hypothetical protein
MNFKRLTLGLTVVFSLGAAPVLAAPPDISRQQLAIKGALNTFDLDLGQERIEHRRHGRQDIVYQTRADHDRLVLDLKLAYQNDRVLPGGYRVSGWAFIDARQSYTFTFEDVRTRDSYVAEVTRAPQGAEVNIRGSVFQWRGPRAPLSQIPRRYAPVGGNTIVR